MDHLTLRARHCVGFLLAALVSAILLRHTLHIYGGLSPEEIRQYTVVALISVVVMLFVFRHLESRNSHFHDDDPPGRN
jgi:heme/copper-type cytochrome/quinol oxidase subunit 4